VTLQFGASLTDDTRSVNYDRNTFIIQATELKLSKSDNLIPETTFLPKLLIVTGLVKFLKCCVENIKFLEGQ
jgi:hypothetical protein